MRLNPQQRIVLIYVVLGGLWIFLSDLFIDALREPAARATATRQGLGLRHRDGILLPDPARGAGSSPPTALVDTDQTIRA
jgi:hypothetical protein